MVCSLEKCVTLRQTRISARFASRRLPILGSRCFQLVQLVRNQVSAGAALEYLRTYLFPEKSVNGDLVDIPRPRLAFLPAFHRDIPVQFEFLRMLQTQVFAPN